MQIITLDSYESIVDECEKYNHEWNLPRQGRNQLDLYPLRAFYRGQSIADWSIRCSLNVHKDNGEEITRPDGFLIDTNKSLFDTIAYIQHYCTGTRFVDFTTNIDVALYFACCDNQDKSGAVFIWLYEPHLPSWYTTKIICEIDRLYNREYVTIEELSKMVLAEKIMGSEAQDIESLNATIISFLESGFMVMPDYDHIDKTNERLLRQKGAFFICPPKFVDEVTSTERIASHAGRIRFIPDSAQDIFDIWRSYALTKIKIPADAKREILLKLENKGIRHGFLFP